MNLESYVNEINNGIASFINENYPQFQQLDVGYWANTNNTELRIWEECLMYMNDGVYLTWQVKISDRSGELDSLTLLKEFMERFKYKPAYDPDFKDNGIYDTGVNQYGVHYAKCWIVPDFPEGVTENHIL